MWLEKSIKKFMIAPLVNNEGDSNAKYWHQFTHRVTAFTVLFAALSIFSALLMPIGWFIFATVRNHQNINAGIHEKVPYIFFLAPHYWGKSAEQAYLIDESEMLNPSSSYESASVSLAGVDNVEFEEAIYLVKHELTEQLKLMIDKGVDILKKVDQTGMTLAMIATQNGCIESLKVIFEADKSIRVRAGDPLRELAEDETRRFLRVYFHDFRNDPDDGRLRYISRIVKKYEEIKSAIIGADLSQNKEAVNTINLQLDDLYAEILSLNKAFFNLFLHYYDLYYVLLVLVAEQFDDKDALNKAINHLTDKFEEESVYLSDALIVYQIKLEQAMQNKDTKVVEDISKHLENSPEFTVDTPGYSDCMMMIGSYYADFKNTDEVLYENSARFFKLAGGYVEKRWESVKCHDEQRSPSLNR